MVDSETPSVVLTDCPVLWCGLPAELRESFSVEQVTRVVLLCAGNHAVALDADEIEDWFDPFP